MPIAGGFYMSYSVDSIRLHPYVESHQFFFLTIQLVFLIFTVYFALRILRDLMAMGLAFYSSPRCWIDLGLAATSSFLVSMFIVYNIQLYDVSVHHADTTSYRQLFFYDRLMRAAAGSVGLLAILRGVLLCRYIPMMTRLTTVMGKATPYIVASVMFGAIIWLAVSAGASALFGRHVVQLRTLTTSLACTLYSVARVYNYDAEPLLTSFFVIGFVLFVLCVARALCAVGLLASFYDVSQLPDADDVRLYFNQLAQNFRDALSCVDFRDKRRMRKKAAADAAAAAAAT